MKKLVLITVILAMANMVFGEETEALVWKRSVVGGLNMTQTGFDNWAAGGENALAWQMNLNYSFIKETDKISWSNTGKFLYGATKTGDADMRKSTDEIKAESVLTYKLGSKINPFIAVTGETQFGPGYNYKTDPGVQISDFMDPGYFRESLGAGMVINKSLSTRIGLSLKQTITSEYQSPYADDPETIEIEDFKSEFGAESVTDASFKISETSSFTSKLELFSAFKAVDKIDVNFDNILMVKVSEYINMNINVKLVYDRDLSAKRQIKQSMALGLNYTFI